MFSVFAHYPTFLVFLAIVIAAALTMAFMPLWIRMLRSSHIGQQVRADGPQSHLVKQGTPTMGGVIMLVAVAITIVLVAGPSHETFLLAGATLIAGALGLIDDASKVVHERSLGLTPKAKLVGQFLVSTLFGLLAVNLVGIAPTVEIPFVATIDLGILTSSFTVGDVVISVPWLYLVFVDILLMGLCNAVNLTDGLDGLAAGTVMIVMLVMAAIAYRSGMLDPAVFAAALAGSCIGFLWFNSYPADIFMGDTGSLALGMALGCLAVLTKIRVHRRSSSAACSSSRRCRSCSRCSTSSARASACSSWRPCTTTSRRRAGSETRGRRALLDHLGRAVGDRLLHLLRRVPDGGELAWRAEEMGAPVRTRGGRPRRRPRARPGQKRPPRWPTTASGFWAAA